MFNKWKILNYYNVVKILHQRILHSSTSKLINSNTGYHQLCRSSSNQLGQIYLWGAADCGIIPQISSKTWNDPTLKTPYLPVPSLLPVDTQQISSLAIGYNFLIMAAHGSSNVLVTGLNSCSQLGLPASEYATVEDIRMVEFSNDFPIQQMACGRAHSLILTADNKVFSAGSNVFGQCGVDRSSQELAITKFTELVSLPDVTFKQICCGLDHSLLVSTEGQVFSCGINSDGQTGLGEHAYISQFNCVEGLLGNKKIIHVATSADTVLALADDSSLYGWGDIEYGLLRQNEATKQISLPVRINIDCITEKIIQVAIGGTFCLVCTENGNVYVWGYGALGLGKEIVESQDPQLVRFPDGVNIKKIACSTSHAIALSDTGNIYTWGRGCLGKLGIGNDADVYTPCHVPLEYPALDIYCGPDHTAVII